MSRYHPQDLGMYSVSGIYPLYPGMVLQEFGYMHIVWFYLQRLCITVTSEPARLHNHKTIETGLDA